MTAACHTHNRSTNSQGPGTLGLVLALTPNLALAFTLAVKVMALALCRMVLLTSLLIAIDGVLGFGKGVCRGFGDRRPPVRSGGKALVEVWRKKPPKDGDLL